jgi:hypothetical protein
MPYEQRPGSGTLFRNREKKNDKHPDLKGDALVEIDGQLYALELAAWTKQSELAGEFFSVSIRLKGQQQTRPGNGRQHFNQRVAEMGMPVDAEGALLDDKNIPFALPGDASSTRHLPRA